MTKRAKKITIAWRIFWVLTLFSFITAMLGTAIYMSIVFMPLISASLAPLAMTLGLAAIPHAITLGLVAIIAALPFIFTSFLMLKWIFLHIKNFCCDEYGNLLSLSEIWSAGKRRLLYLEGEWDGGEWNDLDSFPIGRYLMLISTAAPTQLPHP